MLRLTSLSALSLALALSLVACGGGGGSGLDSDAALTELSGEERAELCAHLEESAENEDARELQCILEGLVAELQGGDCQAIIDECLAANEPLDEIDCSNAANEEFPACAANITVGEFEACIDAQMDLVADAAGSLQCGDEIPEFPEPEACAVLDEKCPDDV